MVSAESKGAHSRPRGAFQQGAESAAAGCPDYVGPEPVGFMFPRQFTGFQFPLMMAPPQVIDYVIVHELMHIRQKNHSSKFWRLVIEAMPDSFAHRRWLREHQDMLKL